MPLFLEYKSPNYERVGWVCHQTFCKRFGNIRSLVPSPQLIVKAIKELIAYDDRLFMIITWRYVNELIVVPLHRNQRT